MNSGEEKEMTKKNSRRKEDIQHLCLYNIKHIMCKNRLENGK